MFSDHNKILKVFVATLLLVYGLSIACGRKVVEPASEERAINELNPPLFNSNDSELITISPEDIRTIQRFAENYEPRSSQEAVIPSPPVPPKTVLDALARLRAAHSSEHEKFVALVFLKLERFQIEHFKQTYELGRTNPLTLEFYRLLGKSDYQHLEIMPANLAEDLIRQHAELADYPPIKRELNRIRIAGEKIEKELKATVQKAS